MSSGHTDLVTRTSPLLNAPPHQCDTYATVLLVEHDDLLRGAIGEFLIRQGYLVIAAGDGEEALRLARHAGHLDALITGSHVPGRHAAEIPAVARSRILRLEPFSDAPGAPNLLRRPFTFRALAEKLRALLAAPEHS